jgi:hypothetical protein
MPVRRGRENVEAVMNAEVQSLISDIEQSVELLRRHL